MRSLRRGGRWTSIFLLSALCGSPGITSGEEPAGRQPAPDAKELEAALALVQDVFKDQYAKRSAVEQQGLGRKLYQEGVASRSDMDLRFVLLQEAARVSAAAGDPVSALKALDELGRSFAYNIAQAKAGVLGQLVPKCASADEGKELSRLCLLAVDDAVQSEDFDSAVKLAALAETAARQSNDPLTVSRAQVRSRDLKDVKGELDKAATARQVLAEKPDDPSANLTVGRFECLVKGDWESGLQKLLKGNDDDFKLAAKFELTPNLPPEEFVKAADAWWSLAEKTSFNKNALLGRAKYWYLKSKPHLSGFTKLKVDKRLQDQLANVAATGAISAPAAPSQWKFDYSDHKALTSQAGGWLRIKVSSEHNFWDRKRNGAPFYVRPLRIAGDALVVSYRLPASLPSASQVNICLWDGAHQAAYCGPYGPAAVACEANLAENPAYHGKRLAGGAAAGQLKVEWEADGGFVFSWRAGTTSAWQEVDRGKTATKFTHLGVMAKTWGGAKEVEFLFRLEDGK